MSSLLDSIVKETKAAFIIAKGDGVLDASEVIQIAVDLSQKIQKIANLSGSEKKSLLLLALKKGFDASGGVGTLPGFADASPEIKAAFEEQLLSATSATIDALFLAINGRLDLRKPSNWKACLPACLSVASVLVPKDQTQLKEAVEFAGKIVKTIVPEPTTELSPAKQTSTTTVDVLTVMAETNAKPEDTNTSHLPGSVISDK